MTAQRGRRALAAIGISVACGAAADAAAAASATMSATAEAPEAATSATVDASASPSAVSPSAPASEVDASASQSAVSPSAPASVPSAAPSVAPVASDATTPTAREAPPARASDVAPARGGPSGALRDPGESIPPPFTMAELGLGWVVLPSTEICTNRAVQGCRRGDDSLSMEFWQMARLTPRWAVGAGLLVALTPTTDVPSAEPVDIERDHSRRYFTVEAMGRYYAVARPRWELWLGAEAGLAVLSDLFVTRPELEDERALVGPKGATIRTEGFSAGAGFGGALRPHRAWTVGLRFRVISWFLPGEPETNAFGDQASMTGQNTVFHLALNASYRLRL